MILVWTKVPVTLRCDMIQRDVAALWTHWGPWDGSTCLSHWTVIKNLRQSVSHNIAVGKNMLFFSCTKYTTRILWYHPNPLYTHRILFAWRVWHGYAYHNYQIPLITKINSPFHFENFNIVDSIFSQIPINKHKNVSFAQFFNHKIIKRHTTHTIVSWPNPTHWILLYTSDLMMIIRQSNIFSQPTRGILGKLNTYSPIYWIMDN